MLKSLKKLLQRYNLIACVPEHLIPNGRITDNSFQKECKLYRGFEPKDISHINGQILTHTIRFPDFSCNWNKFSSPEDVKYRAQNCENDGCYSVNTDTAQFDNRATPVHDPLNEAPWYNYAHVEIRALRDGENAGEIIPPKKRKLQKSIKLAYRDNFSFNALIELEPTPTKGNS